MGIQGLLPLLKSIQKPTHLRNFAGQTLGVDAYGWLHRGTVACAIELAQGKPTRKHIDFALSRVRMLIHFGVKPYLVFDGDYLPSKAHTERERSGRRKESKKLGLQLLGMGRLSQAYLELQKAVDVTPSMARELIEELKRLDVPFIVAPYEADSQLAYLEKQGIISGVVSEDSDLLVFGVGCLLTKLDQYGECVMLRRTDFTACTEVSLVGWSDTEFRVMAMLSGCDYLPGIEGMGLKTAYRLVRKYKTIEQIVRTVQFDGKKKVPSGYLHAFTNAERTFLYQWVFCPEARCLVNLNKLPAGLDVESMPFLGQQVEPEVAVGVAAGELDPNTKKALIFNTSRNHHPTQRTAIIQTPDEKQGKPITEFFKPNRVPLAELDPNSFTPSPSQQRLLQNQQGASWSASQVDALRPQARPLLGPSNAPGSAPHVSRRTVSEQLSIIPDRSPKRKRLCTDSVLAASMDGAVGLGSATSRFFGRQGAQPSPSLRQGSRRMKARDDFELFSDDSVADAVAEMTATQEEKAAGTETALPKKKKKLQIFADSDPQEENLHVRLDLQRETAETSQDTVTTVATADSQQTRDEETPATSFEAEEPQREHNAFSTGLDSSFAALTARYGLKANFKPKTTARTKSAPWVLGSPLRNLSENGPSGRQSGPPIVPAKKASGVLQRLNDGLAESQDTPVAGPATLAQSSNVNVDGGSEDIINDEEWLALEQQPAVRKPDVTVLGSEDMLVPNSPESTGDDGRHKPKLNLGRFAFIG